MVSSRQKKRCRSTSRGCEWIATGTAGPGGEHRHRGRHPRRRAGDLERDVGPGIGGPVVDPRHHVVGAGIEHPQAERGGQLAAARVGLDEDDLGLRVPGHHRDQDADRPAPDHDGVLAGSNLRPANVVHGHRGRLDQRRCVQGDVRGQRDTVSAGTVQSCCIEPRQSMPRKSIRWQTCWWPARQAGQRAAHVERHHGDAALPADSRRRPSPTAATVPDISCPITAGMRHALRPCRRGRCADRCRTVRCTRTAIGTWPPAGAVCSSSTDATVRAER